MPIPKFDALMLPLLTLAGDEREHKLSAVISLLADQLSLSEDEKEEQIPSGGSLFRNRVYWAKQYLNQAQAIESVGRGIFRITQRGRDLLKRELPRITVKDLLAFTEFQAFAGKASGPLPQLAGETPVIVSVKNEETPQEAIETASREIEKVVVRELLDAVQASTPKFLEDLIIKVLIGLGYGDRDAGEHLGRSHDGGIDGIVKKDRLGLSKIYIQAKRYKNGSSVGAPEIQQFAGSMNQNRASEGVFVTTSTFTKLAQQAASQLSVRIVLIDGERLAQLMFELGLGVTTQVKFEIKRIDLDFFAEQDLR